MTRLMYVQSKLSKQTQTKTKQEKLNGGKSLPGKPPPVAARAPHAPAPENKPLNPEAPRASEQPNPPNHGEKTRFAALTRDLNRKPPQAREGMYCCLYFFMPYYYYYYYFPLVYC
jgi:hypothetical protein